MSVSKLFISLLAKGDENLKAGYMEAHKHKEYVSEITGIYSLFSEGRIDAPECIECMERQTIRYGVA